MRKTVMKDIHTGRPLARPMPRQRGVTLTETLLVLGLAALLAAVAYRAFGTARADARLQDLSSGTIALVNKVSLVFGGSADYSALTPENLVKAGALPSQFRHEVLNGQTVLRDLFGNEFVVNGAQGSWSFHFTNLTREACTTLAPQLAALAYAIRAGTEAEAANGVVGNRGVEVKAAGGTVNTANLLTGCSEDNRKLAVEIRS
jgi:prepilin-type N-terminal cleavage/methylation domain-containing protein